MPPAGPPRLRPSAADPSTKRTKLAFSAASTPVPWSRKYIDNALYFCLDDAEA
ncbi:hypothetical protein L13192_04240 [Pyrenophora tritici-repentis]|uniref:Uncharacterized protein n=1 Tax=Pyrenophora tritici-repentis TaxID=45151 RepID=A0A922SX24_9PLEO|nr:hypothetical protein Ptr86124_011643 [Pyrenophora tritici-repentis]KAI1670883.1 hypothetical protein L13192_04240 [Pyrenophora tritici-repentis]KAI1684622.1 hypothetical protein KJE20_04906 [Pyrenophora tritici-repentis]